MPRLLKDRRLWLAAFAFGVIFAILAAFVNENHTLAALGYLAIYVTVVSLSLPSAMPLTLSGGFLFGATGGALLALTGATLGATILFLFARTMMGDEALSHFGPRGAKVARALKANAWSYLLVMRLLPAFPFFLVNIIPALAGVRLKTFVLATFFGIMPATFVFSLSGAGLGEILDRGGDISIQSILTPEILAALTVLAMLALSAIPLRRKLAQLNFEAPRDNPLCAQQLSNVPPVS
jgi:uncharacterized membrane protein YdjX (TVP38/TMEM64 family)